MDTSQSDDVSRFSALHDESLKLLEAARSLMVEMRASLDECRRRRPVVESRREGEGANHSAIRSRLEKTRRGGRVSKGRGRRRRPR